MRARAPGKLVLSGAYAVLEGAPALVAAVDRYVVANDAEPAQLVTLEVKEAVARGALPAPVAFDASALRKDDRKLGLGSSAAILVASMATASHAAEPDLAAQLFEPALVAHRAAQGGGSGVDVAAACFGGVVRCVVTASGLEVSPHRLPADLAIACWACPGAASTRNMLEQVRGFAGREPAAYRALMTRLHSAAVAAVDATNAAPFIRAIEAQRAVFSELGAQANVPIITPEVAALEPAARAAGACFAPSGAGGGDVALLFHREGTAAELGDFRARAVQAGLIHVPMQIGAAGVSRF